MKMQPPNYDNLKATLMSYCENYLKETTCQAHEISDYVLFQIERRRQKKGLKDIYNIESYCKTAARNYSIKFREKYAYVEINDASPSEYQLYTPQKSLEESIDVHTILNTLLPERRAFFKDYMNGFSHKELAKKYRITAVNSRTKLYRIKKELKSYLSNLDMN